MRTSRKGILRGAALLVFLATVGLPSAFADDPPAPFDPLESRIRPPSGVTSESRIRPPGGDESTADVRNAAPRTNSRIKPPGGVTAPEPDWFELLSDWLRARVRISPVG